MTEDTQARSSVSWSRIARRIRVPLGFLFAVFYFWRARPDWISLALGGVVAAAGVFFRAMASGHVKKNEQLATTGPYAYCRNPLYLGSIIIAIGFAIGSRDFWVAIGIIGLFSAIYVPVIRGEETFLREKFAGFDDYAKRVPRMLPRFTAARYGDDDGGFSMALYLKHREWNALLGSVLLAGALILKMTFLP